MGLHGAVRRRVICVRGSAKGDGTWHATNGCCQEACSLDVGAACPLVRGSAWACGMICWSGALEN